MFLGVLPAPAIAAAGQPQGEFAPFAACPLHVITLTDCIATRSEGGQVAIGTRTIRLSKPIVVQGGAEGGGEEVTFHHPESAETLVTEPQPVPGAMQGVKPLSWWPEWIKGWFEEGLGGQSEVTATIELATPEAVVGLDTERLLRQEGTALGMPVKIRLENPLLGTNCHLGSAAEPVDLNFTTAESGPVKGKTGNVTFNKENTLSTISGGRLVDGVYALPRAQGCGGLLSYFLDPLIDEVLQLPSAPTSNTAVLEGRFQDAQAEAVRASG